MAATETQVREEGYACQRYSAYKNSWQARHRCPEQAATDSDNIDEFVSDEAAWPRHPSGVISTETDWPVSKAKVGLSQRPRPWPPDVVAFCQEHDVEQDVLTAEKLAKASFNTDTYTLTVEGDPESNHQWVVVLADAGGSIEEVLCAYYECKKEWLSVASPRGQSFVRFAYNIA